MPNSFRNDIHGDSIFTILIKKSILFSQKGKNVLKCLENGSESAQNRANFLFAMYSMRKCNSNCRLSCPISESNLYFKSFLPKNFISELLPFFQFTML